MVNALKDQIALFKQNYDSAEGANALRFIIHLVGDAHQPLHAEDNNDRGGNCIPAAYLKVPAKRIVEGKDISYDPELHSIWDKYIIDGQVSSTKKITTVEITTFANSLYGKTESERVGWATFTLDGNFDSLLLSWVMDAHDLASSVGYGHLVAGTPPRAVSAKSLAGPADLASCEDGNFQEAIANKHVAVNGAYVSAAGPVIDVQLEKAGIRLARVLDQLWESVGQ